jgi:glutathione synthase
VTDLLRGGPIVVQELLPNAAAGDKRIVMVDGEPLRAEGEIVAVRRVPAEGELRSNLHAGGRPEATTLSEAERALVSALGPELNDAGLRVAGVDVLADKVLEINVWAPGGLGPFEKTTGIDAAPTLVAALLDAVSDR